MGTLGFFGWSVAESFRNRASVVNFWKRVLTVILAISVANWGEGIGSNRASLATASERDGGGCVNDPWAVNVVHNLLDFLADNLHTNDRI
jgi:hypothetical protein